MRDSHRPSIDQAGEPSTSDEYPHFTAPAGLLDAGDMIAVEIRGTHPRHPGWATPMKVYIRRTADGWRVLLCTAYEEKRLDAGESA